MSTFDDISRDNLHLLLQNLNLESSDILNTANSSRSSQNFIAESRNINSFKMPMKNSDISSLCGTLPEFSTGDNLSTFIKSVVNLLTFLATQELTAPQEFILNANIVSRIKGEPRDFLNYSNKTTWQDVRPALLAKYGDRRSEDILVTQFSTTVQKHNETYDEYHQRVLNNLNDLLQHITLNNNTATINFKTPYFKGIALKTFCSGINEPYCEYLSHFQINSLEEALQKCITYDNHKNQQQYMNFLKSQQNKKPSSFKQSPNNPNQTNFNPARITPNVFSRNNHLQPNSTAPQRNNSQPNFNVPRNNPQISGMSPSRNNFLPNNLTNNTQHFNRSPLVRNSQNQPNISTPMSGIQTITNKTQPMSVSTRRTHNFNIGTATDENPEIATNNFEYNEETENFQEENFQDFQDNPLEEQPPPL